MEKALVERAVFAMRKLARKDRQLQMKYCSDFGDLRMLRLISHHFKEGAPVGRLAKHADVAMPTMSVKLSRLEKQGLIMRRHSESDRRKVLIFITDAGEELLKENYRQYMDSVNRVTDRLGEQETRRLCRTLEVLRSYIDREILQED